jgi:glycosyltransferase involved in cell wall biosynthesis
VTSVVVGGSLAQRAGYGGHAWAFLNFLLGFRQLGYDVLFVDRLSPEMAVDAAGVPSAEAEETCVRWLAEVMAGAGLGDCYSLFLGDGSETVGVSRASAIEQVADSLLLLNVMGFVDDEEILAASPRNVFLDIDPGFGQMWRELGLHDAFTGHDSFVTVGERIGESDCLIPNCGIEWITTPHPIPLEEWQPVGEGRAITSVGAWRGPYDAVEYEGRRFGLRAHELRKLLQLPGMVREEIELALDIDPADAKDREALLEHDWRLADPMVVAGDPQSYRRYIEASRAELMVAKGMYVDTRSGWFSERSIAYLASGRPVIAQDTGFSERYPCGEGLIAFSDVDGARQGIEDVCADWPRHSRAAREIAEEHFEAGRVLQRLMERLGVA